jgi:branched-chain amino acid transport system ATP-binding protein
MLQVKSIHVFYGDVQVLWDVSLDLDQGEIATILGPNGAGKTTTLKTVSGLLCPKNGSILLNGVRLDRLPAFKLSSLGISLVPEGRHLFYNMTVKENLLIGAYYPQARVRREESLDRITQLFPRLKERFDQLAGTLSGGEQQMCAIGRSLMAKPRFLLLDEPSLGLAPFLVQTIFEVIQKINEQEKVSILLVEQNAQFALRIAKRGYVLENGHITFCGPTKDLMNSKDIQRAYLGL